ncbi:MAG: PIN domain-containing protein [Luteitalea sp.]|nr:PIN domain-containing protein [Luteitalea sp.]
MTDDQVRADAPTAIDELASPASPVHLDTSFLINALVPGTPEDGRLRGWLEQGTAIAISCIGWAEFLCGPVSHDDRQRARKVVGMPLPLVEEEAVQAAALFNVGGRRRGSLPDSLIAAAALKAGATLATSNGGAFRRFKRAGLKLVSD